MDSPADEEFEEAVIRTAKFLLEEGDHSYIFGLSRPELIDALEAELKFLGFYPYDDHETPKLIRAILEKNLSNWI